MGILEKESSVVIIKNNAEHAYFNKWAESESKMPPFLGDAEKYPIAFTTAGTLLGWTDSMNRNLNYISFDRFLAELPTPPE